MSEKINWDEVTLSPAEMSVSEVTPSAVLQSPVEVVSELPQSNQQEASVANEIRAKISALEKPTVPQARQEATSDGIETHTSPEIVVTDETLQEFANSNLGSLAYDAERWSGADKKINIADTLRAQEKEAKGDKLATAGLAVGTAGAIGILSIPGMALLAAGGTTLLAAGAFAMLPAAGLGFLGHKGYKIFKSWKSNRAFEKLTGESHKDVLRRNEMIRL